MHARFWAFIIFAFIMSSCSDEQTQTPTEKPIKEAPKKTKKTAPKAKKKAPKKEVKITNDNVVSFLTQYGKENPETIVRLSCKYGDIDMRLYKNTPLHRANMIYLTKRGYFDLTQFYRVSKGFVDQAGNSDEWETQIERAKIGHYTLPAELRDENIHKYGAVAMARRYDENPNKRSSPYEFYIVLGHTYNKVEVRGHEREYGTKYTDEQKAIYINKGGTPFLDQQHTVFGEVISGMDVVKEINKVKVDNREWPNDEIAITMKVIR